MASTEESISAEVPFSERSHEISALAFSAYVITAALNSTPHLRDLQTITMITGYFLMQAASISILPDAFLWVTSDNPNKTIDHQSIQTFQMLLYTWTAEILSRSQI